MGFPERYNAMTRTYPWQDDISVKNQPGVQQAIQDMNLQRINYAGGVLNPRYAPLVRNALNVRRNLGNTPPTNDEDEEMGIFSPNVGRVINQEFPDNVGSVEIDIGRGEPIYRSAQVSLGGGQDHPQYHGERSAMMDVLNQINRRALDNPGIRHPVLEGFRQQEKQHGLRYHGASPPYGVPPANFMLLNTRPEIIQEYNDALYGYGNPANVKIYSEKFPCSGDNPNSPTCANFFPKLLEGLDSEFLYSAPIMDYLQRRNLLRNQARAAEVAQEYVPNLNPTYPNYNSTNLRTLFGDNTKPPLQVMNVGYRPPPGQPYLWQL